MRLIHCYPIYLCLLILISVGSFTWAEEDEEGEEGVEEEASPSIYVQIKPSFVTNFQSDQLRYIKADIAVRVSTAETQNAIEQHLDAIKNAIVLLLSRQDFETVTSIDGVAEIREEALALMVEILEKETAPSDITEVLFTSFLVE